MHKNALYCILGLALAIAPGRAQNHHYVFKTVDSFGSPSTQIEGINNRGEIAGSYLAFPCDDVCRNFYGPPGNLQTVVIPGSTISHVKAINERGILVGTYWDGEGFHGFIFQNGLRTDVNVPDVPGAMGTALTDIDDAGARIAGFYMGSDSVAHGFIRSRGDWTKFTYPNAPNVTCTIAWGLNNSGWVAGAFSIPATIPPVLFAPCPGAPAGETHAYLRRPDGFFLPLDPPRAVHRAMALDVNNAGEVVGVYYDGNTEHGFLYANGKFTDIDFPNANTTIAFGINDKGDIVGSYRNEPSTPTCAATDPFCGKLHGFVATKAGN
jgi:probable HAF family extracellular repeat protein